MQDVSLSLAAGHGQGQASVAYARVRDELMIATCGADGVACLRDGDMLEAQRSCKSDHAPATVLAVDPKGRYMAVGDEQYVKVRGKAPLDGGPRGLPGPRPPSTGGRC